AKAAAKGLARIGLSVSEIPGVTHVDGSARVQTVDEGRNPRFFRLLRAFEAQTQCPVLLNTSFNLRGEPIVCTPQDAVRTFLASHMDALALGSWLVVRPDGPPRPLAPPPARPPTRGATRRFGRDTGLGLALAAVILGLRGGPVLRVVAGVLAAFAVGTLAVAFVRPLWFTVFVRIWTPASQRIARLLSRLLFGLVHVFVMGPLALLRRRAPVPWLRGGRSGHVSHWLPWEAPRGGAERMY
ncbi:MAG TPA: carbamoyltransferase C-terminal domain-containing protein, partial [Polyangiaceae bacterium]|nr:carbamoyltransferase C-terminal domain-containing protein [Polyangiaceae bacterium]